MTIKAGSIWADVRGTTYEVISFDRGDPFVFFKHENPVYGDGGGGKYMCLGDFLHMTYLGMSDRPSHVGSQTASESPSFNHDRADGPFDPCPLCAQLMTKDDLVRAVSSLREFRNGVKE